MRALLFAVGLAACSSSPAPTDTPSTPEASKPVATQGRYVRTELDSAALGVSKDIIVYLPPGYDDDTAKRWPVVLYLHGLTSNEASWVDKGHIDQAAEKLGFGAILVMPDGDDSFYSNSLTPMDYDACMADGKGLFFPQRPHKETCVRTPNYEQYIVTDVIGWVDREYRTLGTREGRGIAGLSMGGFGALMLSLRHPDLFAAAASHSGVVAPLFNGPIPYEKAKVRVLTDPKEWGRSVGEMGAWVRGIYGADIQTWKAHDPVSLVQAMPVGQLALYVDCGTEDEFALENQAQYLHDVLLDRGIEHVYYLGPGKHDMAFWSVRVADSLAFFQSKLAPAK